MVNVARHGKCGPAEAQPAEVAMSRMRSRNYKTGTLASGARTARRMAAQVRPLAGSTGAAAARRVHKTRAWVAPQVERAGQVLQDSVAPRVSALLSSAARRLQPARPSRPRWRKLVGGSGFTAPAAPGAALRAGPSNPDPASS